MDSPLCPSCSTKLTFATSLKMFNPWRCKCPSCGEKLEMGMLGKLSFILAFPLGLIAARFSTAQQQSGDWQLGDSLLFLGSITLAVLVFCWATWPYYRFHRRE